MVNQKLLIKENAVDFVEIANSIGKLLEQKNAAYGGSYAKTGAILGILYPNGVKPEQYQEVLVITRILDKLGRISHDKKAFDEDPWKDIAGYAILQLALEKVETK